MPIDIDDTHLSIVCMCTNEMEDFTASYGQFGHLNDNEKVMKCPACNHMIHIYYGTKEANGQ